MDGAVQYDPNYKSIYRRRTMNKETGIFHTRIRTALRKKFAKEKHQTKLINELLAEYYKENNIFEDITGSWPRLGVFPSIKQSTLRNKGNK